MNILEVKNVNKSFANHKALNDVSLAVPEGSIFGLLGPNGAGKTTLIRIINHITAPDDGMVLFRNQPLHISDVRMIGYLPEERGLYRKMKVGEQAVYLAQLKGLDKTEAQKRLVKWFRKFEIESWWDKKVEELSKGMQQKIQFITTILHQPKLLIFDEPFSGFDPINAAILKEEILNLKKSGATIIFSTHNMESVEELCDHITLINKSRIILNGTVNQIKDTFKTNTYVLDYKFIDEEKNEVEDQPGLFKIINTIPTEFGYRSLFQLDNVNTQNELIKSLLNQISIKSFNEVIPSMNEIFIKVVNANK